MPFWYHLTHRRMVCRSGTILPTLSWIAGCFTSLSLSLSFLLRFNGYFPGGPGLASFTEAKDDGSGGDNWSCKSCKAPVKLSPPTNQHTTRRCESNNKLEQVQRPRRQHESRADDSQCATNMMHLNTQSTIIRFVSLLLLLLLSRRHLLIHNVDTFFRT